jgi:hypothetical protein
MNLPVCVRNVSGRIDEHRGVVQPVVGTAFHKAAEVQVAAQLSSPRPAGGNCVAIHRLGPLAVLVEREVARAPKLRQHDEISTFRIGDHLSDPVATSRDCLTRRAGDLQQRYLQHARARRNIRSRG